ncbi:hypothetical protein QYE76_071626 [Lolium multiflorum]|uniref:Uncharacterized protein n=1 Tax=Lolium multiflorum TaxID=4521 RepID=A0AAD8WES2_LOLMU|nr:hypothetical protein QYE76_071626 [Lolium multiflorum]
MKLPDCGRHPLWIVSVEAGAWGNAFRALLQDTYGHLRDKVQLRIWCCPGGIIDYATIEHHFNVIKSREDTQSRYLWFDG